jgi:hypothetical protein
MIDIKKLQAFLQSPQRWNSLEITPPGGTQRFDEDEAEEIRDALADPVSDEAQKARLLCPSVNYVELVDQAGAFSCGTCRFATDDGVCLHEQVRAAVDRDHGCCCLFAPSDPSSQRFPPSEEFEATGGQTKDEQPEEAEDDEA